MPKVKEKKEKAEKTEEKKSSSVVSEKYSSQVWKVSQKRLVEYNPSEFISTRSRRLNEIISGSFRCGIPRGRITEVYGPESSGKTTLTLHIIAEELRSNPKAKALYVDAEHGLDLKYAEALGVDMDRFWVVQPDCGEDAFEIMFDAIEMGKVTIIAVDSVACLVPRAEIEGTMDDKGMGLHARLMSQGLRKLSGKAMRSNIPIIFINQLRMKIGSYGNPETTTGGNALKFYAWVRLDVRSPRGDALKEKGSLDDDEGEEGENETGTLMTIKTVKNKIFVPHKKCQVLNRYGKGIDVNDDLIRLLDHHGVIAMHGKKIIYRKKTMIRRKFLDRFKSDKEFRKRIRQEIEG